MMLVLLDIEWTEKTDEEKELTQLAAIRLDEQWDKKERFNQLVCPAEGARADWKHVAFCGYGADAFLAGCSEADSLHTLERWLQPADTVCVWSNSSKRTLKERWQEVMGRKFEYPIAVANETVYDLLRRQEQLCYGVYAVAGLLGVCGEETEHCAEDDVSVMHRVLRKLGIDQALLQSKAKKPKLKGRELIEKLPYHYLYTPTSEVFHTRNCGAILRAKEIHGCATYKTAVKHRRPCALCHPTDLNPPKAVCAPAFLPAENRKEPEEKTLVRIRLFDGSVIRTYSHKIVGCCHYRGHPGKINRKLMEQHNCIGKQCRYFRKNEASTYWEEAQRQADKKEREKIKQQEEKERQRAKAERLRYVGEELQYYLDLCGYQVDVLVVEEAWTDAYKVLYVSDKPYADGHLYKEFYDTIQHLHPSWRVLMKHIKNENGYFVTLDEYYARRRA